MAERLDPKETVSFKELLFSNMIEIQALAQLLMEKGIITEQEYFAKLKQVQQEYQKRQRS
jgi:mannitol/fructose-specific phosphotransferase system IIA component (Ntr-type)